MPATAAGQAADPVIAAAGDIACSPNSSSFNGGEGTDTACRQRHTSNLLVSGGYSAVLALGDTQYENGEYSHFLASYGPSWGRVKSITRPAIGNHEYHEGSGTPPGSGYFDYFNGVGAFTGIAGDRDKGYYSFNVGGWHLVAINSMCDEVDGCDPGSPQERWLREDLFANRRSCTLAYWHHPLYSSGGIGNNRSMQPIYQALYEAGADLVLAGHDHNYERFAPQDASGAPDPAFGIREFVVGTGGKTLREMGIVKANSEVRQNQSYGILSLTLRRRAYDFRFIPDAVGTFTDSGSGNCHGGPPGAYPGATTGRASLVTDPRASASSTGARAGSARRPGRSASSAWDRATAPSRRASLPRLRARESTTGWSRRTRQVRATGPGARSRRSRHGAPTPARSSAPLASLRTGGWGRGAVAPRSTR
jgi:hypothetical protein